MGKIQTFTVYGRLDALNDYINANRINRYKGAKVKRDNQDKVLAAIEAADLAPYGEQKVRVTFNWVEPNKRRDPDNIASACKYIFDALVEAKVLNGDSQKYVSWPIVHNGSVDKCNPRIEVVMEVVE